MENDMLIELIIRSLPDMSVNELSELETAVNAELQDRAQDAVDEWQDEGPDVED